MRKLLTILSILFATAASAQVKVIAPIEPNNLSDKYPTHNAQYGKGGYRSVTSITERNSISAERRTIGMEVYVADSAKSYRLLGGVTDANWQEVTGFADGNNYPDGVSASNGVISIGRSGLTAITGTASGSWNINAATVTDGLYSTGSYANPTWLTSLSWSKITGAPAFITGNQSITFTPTGDVTGTATGATALTPALTIGNGKVTLAKMATTASGNVMYRKTTGTGAPEWQSLATLRSDLNIPAAQIAADWNQTNPAALDFIKNKPVIPAAQVAADWSQANTSAPDYIKNKPTIPAAQIAADWNQTNPAAMDFIKNKPIIPEECNLLFQNMQDDPMDNLALAAYFNSKQNTLIRPGARQYIGMDLAVRDLGPDVFPLFKPQYPISLDTVTGALTNIAANIGNLDTTGIFGGTYFVNAGTRGTKPPGSTGGIVMLMISSVNNYMTGTDKAVMTYYDYSSKITFTRYFDVNWSDWSTPYINTTTGGIFTSNKAMLGFPDYAASFPQPPIANGFYFGSNAGMPTFSTYSGKTMFDLSAVTGIKTFSLPNSAGEVTVAGNAYNTASNLVKLNASAQFPAIDANLLFGYKANKLSAEGGTVGQILTVDPLDPTKAKWADPPGAGTTLDTSNLFLYQTAKITINGETKNLKDNPSFTVAGGGGGGDYVDIAETALDLSTATQTGTTPASGLSGTYEGYKIGAKWVQVDFLIIAGTPGTGVTGLEFPFPSGLPTPNIPSSLTGKNNIIKIAEIGAASVTQKTDPLQNSRAYLKRNDANDGFVISIVSNSGNPSMWRVSLKYKVQEFIP